MNISSCETATIVANSWIREVVRLESIGSTNDAAKRLLESEQREIPLLVLTSKQTAGRGQQGNVWWSDIGSLTFSVVFDGNQITTTGLIAFAAAIAVKEAIQAEDAALIPKVKWPNDVYLSNRKVAGILIESITRQDRRFYVVGIGVNVNCDFSLAPRLIQRSAISINGVLQRSLEIEPLLIRLLNQLQQNLQRAIHSPAELVVDYAAHSLFDESVQLTVRMANGQSKMGQFCGFTPQGLLRLKSGSEIWETSTGHIESPTYASPTNTQ